MVFLSGYSFNNSTFNYFPKQSLFLMITFLSSHNYLNNINFCELLSPLCSGTGLFCNPNSFCSKDISSLIVRIISCSKLNLQINNTLHVHLVDKLSKGNKPPIVSVVFCGWPGKGKSQVLEEKVQPGCHMPGVK